jgi:glutamate formiminotransferase
VVTIPNWSFYNPDLVSQGIAKISGGGAQINYAQGDADHGRTVTALSGEFDQISTALIELMRAFLPYINLGEHVGVHPKAGAMDVCPFVSVGNEEAGLNEKVWGFAAEIWKTFEIPVRLYELSALQTHTNLPYLRGQKGAIEQSFDFGSTLHPRWGQSVVGMRRPLLAANINIATPDKSYATRLAKLARSLRDSGDPNFVGVRALGFALPSRAQTQLSLNLTEPSDTSFDFLYEWASSELNKESVKISGTELIGVIRSEDLPKSRCLTIESAQILTPN